jgi:AbrB family looped-hinge helix DNA binding protein
MPFSRITSKGQVTLPKEVREALDLGKGDLLAYEIQDKVAILKKVEPFDWAFHGAVAETLEEWESPEDEEAFGDL